jgi:hypothetical protein
VRRTRRPVPFGSDRPLELLELGPQLPVLALKKRDAPPLGYEILGHLAQCARNALGSDLRHLGVRVALPRQTGKRAGTHDRGKLPPRFLRTPRTPVRTHEQRVPTLLHVRPTMMDTAR